ncbi:hypothetical protein CWC11_17460 [Pseudoalteromonas sp. S3178]|uniref:lipopolysaccharide biosynthesis protein n=1 Tax=Pseudoalteromonas sp. S3178 TaxID=579532 RepID=UPI00110B63FA|nr:oligosaccharide flippase family protein [Pseudoalteromonas sp. S3178]TMP02595.1 hypothetical protein CWC11_17460 [Pseudoalteromonas sp. S3178]
MSRLKKDISITFIGAIITALCNILWLALVSREYGVESYGIYVICQNLGVFIATFACVRTGDLIYKYHQANSELFRFIKLFTLLLTLLVSLLVTLVLFFLLPIIAENFYSNIPINMLYLSAVYVFFFSFNNFSLAIIRCNGDFKKLVKIESSMKLAQLIFGAFLIYYTELIPNVTYVFYIWFLFNVLIQIILLILAVNGMLKIRCFQSIKGNFFRYKTDIYSVLYHSNLMGYFKIASSPGDTFLIGLFGGPTQVAIYNVALQVINIGVLVKNNLNNVLAPRIIQLYKRGTDKLKSFVYKYIVYSSVISAFFCLFIYLFGKNIIDLFFGKQPDEIELLLLVMALNYVITLISLCYYPIALTIGKLRPRTILLTIKTMLLFLYIALFGLTAEAFVIFELTFSILIRLINDYPLHKKVFHA